VRALDRGLSRAAWRCRGRGVAPRQPRPRPPCGHARDGRPPAGAAVGRRVAERVASRARNWTSVAMSVPLDHAQASLRHGHEINVTPFIDGMLVLLIIFMVAAPLATVDIQVNLPALDATPQQRDKPIYLTVKSDRTLLLGNNAIGRDALRGALEAAKGGKDQ